MTSQSATRSPRSRKRLRLCHPPTANPGLLTKVTFCVQGAIVPPRGRLSSTGRTRPSSITPAFPNGPYDLSPQICRARNPVVPPSNWPGEPISNLRLSDLSADNLLAFLADLKVERSNGHPSTESSPMPVARNLLCCRRPNRRRRPKEAFYLERDEVERHFENCRAAQSWPSATRRCSCSCAPGARDRLGRRQAFKAPITQT